MKFGKLTNGNLVFAPYPLTVDGKDIFTTDATIYAAQGYKPVVYTDYPSDEKTYTASWVETATEIVRAWTETQPPTPEPTESERLSQLETIVDALLISSLEG